MRALKKKWLKVDGVVLVGKNNVRWRRLMKIEKERYEGGRNRQARCEATQV